MKGYHLIVELLVSFLICHLDNKKIIKDSVAKLVRIEVRGLLGPMMMTNGFSETLQMQIV